MKQLGQLQEIYDAFAQRGIQVIGLSLEAAEMKHHAKTLRRFPDRRFALAGAIGGEGAEGYAMTTGYLVDKQGIIQQVMPMEVYNRPSWWAVLAEVDRLLK